MGGISGGGRRRGVIGSLILDHVVRESESMSKRGNLCTFAGCGVLEGLVILERKMALKIVWLGRRLQ